MILLLERHGSSPVKKLDGTYSFVNLTKGHICTCKFHTVEEAVKDMQTKKENDEVVDYFKVCE